MLKFIVKILKDKHMDIAIIILGKEIHCIDAWNFHILLIVSSQT